MQRIFICTNQSLFGQGVERWLGGEPGLELIGCESDPDQALARIQALQPDVVLLVTGGPTRPAPADGQTLLHAGVTAKIIELNLQNSSVCVYRGERQTVREAADLLRVIEQSLAPRPSETAGAETPSAGDSSAASRRSRTA